MASDDAGRFRPRRLLEVLGEYEVDYILIGGVAGAIHGAPFTTVDLDAVPAVQRANLDRLAAALDDLEAVLRDADTPEGIRVEWSGHLLKKALTEFRFLRFDTRFGYLDLLYRPAGTKGFADLARDAVDYDLDAVRVRVAALDDVIRMKQAAGRPRDLEHLPTLRRLLEIQRTEGR